MTNLFYLSGELIALGDAVDIGGTITGIIEAIVNDQDWAHDESSEYGIYVRTEIAGLIRVSPNDEDLRFLGRATSQF